MELLSQARGVSGTRCHESRWVVTSTAATRAAGLVGADSRLLAVRAGAKMRRPAVPTVVWPEQERRAFPRHGEPHVSLWTKLAQYREPSLKKSVERRPAFMFVTFVTARTDRLTGHRNGGH